MWWSWILAGIGVTGLYLTTKKLAVGFAVGVAVQVLWIAYAIVTGQWGFIASALAYGAVNALGLYRWTRTTETRPPHRIVQRSDAPWRAPRGGGYRGSGGAQPTSPPSGASATSRGAMHPPPPHGGSGQATACDCHSQPSRWERPDWTESEWAP